MIGRMGGGPVTYGAGETLALFLLLLMPIVLIFTQGIVGVIVYLVILLSIIGTYSYFRKRRRDDQYIKLQSLIKQIISKQFCLPNTSYKRFDSYIITKANVYSDGYAEIIYKKIDNGKLVKLEEKIHFFKKDFVGLEIGVSTISIKYKDQFNNITTVEIKC